MKSKFIISKILVFIILFSINFQCSLCEDESEDECTYKPSNCIEEEPEFGYVTIKVTINSLNPEVPISIFNGDVEENDIVLQDTLNANSKTYHLEYTYYSVLAIYKATIDNEIVTINSINGEELEYQVENYCDGVCYTEGNIEIDVEL